MNTGKQVFQTSSRLRWRTFKWGGRLGIFFLVHIIPVAWIAWTNDIKPQLPAFSPTYIKSHEINPKGFTKKELTKYKGIVAFLKAKQHNASLIAAEKSKIVTEKIRAGFYVDWDPQSFFSLQTHIADMNMVIPEWLFIDSASGKLFP